MKKSIAAIILMLTVSPRACAEYDPQHTMLALNMAIVSVNRILTTQDRTVLEWEYENIINRLAIGNIESDPEMKSLYDELLGFINGKRLRQEDLMRLKDSYKRREQEAYYRALSHGFENVHAPENDSLWGWIGSLFVSGASSVGAGYYDYEASKEELHREIKSGEWQLTKDELNACNKLQATLLNSSWSLLSKYHLPNEYRLTQENVREFLSAMNEADPSNRLGRLRFIERKFRVYPPYWFFRAYAAKGAGNEAECRKCFSRFNEVWRPVLNYDPYKLEATKYRIRELAEKGVQSAESLAEIRRLVEVVRDYTPAYDWGSNLFAGIVYFALGDKDEAITCVEYGNVSSGRETEISGAVLAQMKRGRIDVASLPGELRGLFGNESTQQTGIKREFRYRTDALVGACIYRFGDVFMAGIRNAMRYEIERLGGELEIVDSQNRQQLQNDQADAFISKGANALIINLVDRTAAKFLTEKAKFEDIPIIFINREPYAEVLKSYNKVWYVGAKAEEAGIKQGEIIAEYFMKHPEADKNHDGVIQFVMLRGENGHQDAILRTEYAKKAMKDYGLRISELGSESANWSAIQANNKMLGFIRQFGVNRIEAVLANNDDMALGALKALQDSGYNTGNPSRYIPVVGIDATAPAINSIARGEMIGTVLNDADNQGIAAVRIAVIAADGERVTESSIGYRITDGKYIWIPYVKVTQENYKSLLQ